MNTIALFPSLRAVLVCGATATALFGLNACDAAVSNGGGVGYYTSFDAHGDGGLTGDATGGDSAQGTDGTDATSADVAGVDVILKDTSLPYAGVKDSGPTDIGPADTGPVDTGPVDTGPADTGPVDTGPTVDCSKTDYTKVQAILTQNCNGCHSHKFGNSCTIATTSKGGVTSFKSKVNNNSMPPGGFSNPADKALVLKWITDGTICTPPPGCP